MPDLPPLAPYDAMPVAARKIWIEQWRVVAAYAPAAAVDADPTAVHEVRKALRRSRTGFKLFQPYFAPDTLTQHRRCLRRAMRRMGPSRDIAVFRLKLAAYRSQPDLDDAARGALTELSDYWGQQQTQADEQARRALTRPAFIRCRAAWSEWLRQDAEPMALDLRPNRIQEQAPILVYQRLAGVRAFGGRLQDAPLARLHRLRIAFKELRYTLEFFQPLMGLEADPIVRSLDDMQDELGDLNDAAVALRFLAGMPSDVSTSVRAGAEHYHAAQLATIAALRPQFEARWQTIDAPAWRHQLATAVASI